MMTARFESRHRIDMMTWPLERVISRVRTSEECGMRKLTC